MVDMKDKVLPTVCYKYRRRAPLVVGVCVSKYSIIRPLLVSLSGDFFSLRFGNRTACDNLSLQLERLLPFVRA